MAFQYFFTDSSLEQKFYYQNHIEHTMKMSSGNSEVDVLNRAIRRTDDEQVRLVLAGNLSECCDQQTESLSSRSVKINLS